MPISPDIAELFAARFPRYAFSLPCWPEEDILSPTDSLPNLPLQQIEVLYFYGMRNANWALELKTWLQEKSDRRLVFLEPQAERIVHFLKQPFARDVLDLKQVEIFHLSSHREKSALIQELAERHPYRGIFIVPGSGLSASERQNYRRTKLLLLRKTALTHAQTMERLHGHIPLSNLLKNLHHLANAFYVNRWKNAFLNIPVIICGAGPSLNDSIEALKKLGNRAIIMAGGSAIAALTAQGVQPHLAVAIDPNPDEFLRLQNSLAFETPFLFTTRLYPDAFSTSNGPLGYMRTGMSGIPELWFEEEIGLKDLILGAYLPSESLSVTTLAMALAEHFGCNPIHFAGLDLSYSNNRRYAEGVLANEEGDENLQPVDRYLQKRDRQGRLVRSAVRWVMESGAIAQFAKRFKHNRWINCTSNGLPIRGIENQPLDPASEVFSREWDIMGMIHQAVRLFPMPDNTASAVKQKRDELVKSLDAVLSHLCILSQNDNLGKCALAEIELAEELAYNVLFFDIEKTLRKNERDVVVYWKEFKQMASNYRSSF